MLWIDNQTVIHVVLQRVSNNECAIGDVIIV